MRTGILLSIIVTLAVLGNPVLAQSSGGNSKEASKNAHMKLYPVEADKYVNVYVDFDEPTDFTLYLPGTILNDPKEWKVNAKTSYQHSMDVSQLPDGEYTLILTYNGKKQTEHFWVKR